MKKNTALTIPLFLLLGSTAFFVGCDGKGSTSTTSTTSFAPTTKACPNCNGVGRYGKCNKCTGGSLGTATSCNTCSGTGTLLCGYCNGRGTLPLETYPSVKAKWEEDKRIAEEKLKAQEEIAEEKRKEYERLRPVFVKAYDSINVGDSDRETVDRLDKMLGKHVVWHTNFEARWQIILWRLDPDNDQSMTIVVTVNGVKVTDKRLNFDGGIK